AYNMIPATSLDIERVEVLLGPASALYGPNSANGVMHFLTSSPIDNPGTRMSIGGGERSIFQGAFRQAWDFNGQAGLKVSGQYTRGNDFEYVDPAEPAPGTEGARDYFVERYGGEARLDLRPWGESADDGEIVISYGLNNLGSSVELTGIGAGQARDWMYQFGQVRLSKGGLFVQGFLNKSDAGETYLLRTQQPIVDRSTFMAGQARYSFAPTDGLEVVMGSDVQKTNPVTDRTINGRNEDDDNVFEAGGYLHATLALSDKVDLVGAIRADHHSELEDPVYSPRAALMFNPNESTNFRLTYNRAFSTPSNNNLFLDLVAGRVPLFGSFGYDVRTRGVPESGFTWEETCAGGVSSYCMYSPFAAGTQLPANGVVLWDGVIVPVILQDPALQAALGQLGLTPAQFATIIGNPSLTDMTSYLLRFNSENPSVPFIPDPGVSPVARIRPTITNTFEAGYRGVVDGGRLAFSVTGYHTRIKDFVGPLRVETPNVFLEGTSVGAFLVGRMVGAGIPAPVAQQIAGGIAGQVATVPWGTVAADQMDTHDLLLTYKNFGDVQLWGADVGFEYHATEEVTFTGSFSWVDNDCFDFNEDGDCGSASDVALNAPTKKGSFGIVVSPEASGVTLGGRVRSSAGFPMNSGVYVGNVDNYTVVDANVSYQIPGNYDARVVLSVNNLFNKEHQEFIGAPRIGRLALVKLEYAF
ncbi:MAG: TonB-dependent receptor, partial [Gemmatimonadota bacterium]|nr:TonB-dependent receptor [Gemmatimonadota bacterium]